MWKSWKIGTNNLFNMIVDFSVCFEYLYDNNSHLIVVGEKEGQYIILSHLDEETLNEIQIITEITGELEAIRSESYENM